MALRHPLQYASSSSMEFPNFDVVGASSPLAMSTGGGGGAADDLCDNPLSNRGGGGGMQPMASSGGGGGGGGRRDSCPSFFVEVDDMGLANMNLSDDEGSAPPPPVVMQQQSGVAHVPVTHTGLPTRSVRQQQQQQQRQHGSLFVDTTMPSNALHAMRARSHSLSPPPRTHRRESEASGPLLASAGILNTRAAFSPSPPLPAPSLLGAETPVNFDRSDVHSANGVSSSTSNFFNDSPVIHTRARASSSTQTLNTFHDRSSNPDLGAFSSLNDDPFPPIGRAYSSDSEAIMPDHSRGKGSGGGVCDFLKDEDDDNEIGFMGSGLGGHSSSFSGNHRPSPRHHRERSASSSGQFGNSHSGGLSHQSHHHRSASSFLTDFGVGGSHAAAVSMPPVASSSDTTSLPSPRHRATSSMSTRSLPPPSPVSCPPSTSAPHTRQPSQVGLRASSRSAADVPLSPISSLSSHSPFSGMSNEPTQQYPNFPQSIQHPLQDRLHLHPLLLHQYPSKSGNHGLGKRKPRQRRGSSCSGELRSFSASVGGFNSLSSPTSPLQEPSSSPESLSPDLRSSPTHALPSVASSVGSNGHRTFSPRPRPVRLLSGRGKTRPARVSSPGISQDDSLIDNVSTYRQQQLEQREMNHQRRPAQRMSLSPTPSSISSGGFTPSVGQDRRRAMSVASTNSFPQAAARTAAAASSSSSMGSSSSGGRNRRALKNGSLDDHQVISSAGMLMPSSSSIALAMEARAGRKKKRRKISKSGYTDADIIQHVRDRYQFEHVSVQSVRDRLHIGYKRAKRLVDLVYERDLQINPDERARYVKSRPRQRRARSISMYNNGAGPTPAIVLATTADVDQSGAAAANGSTPAGAGGAAAVCGGGSGVPMEANSFKVPQTQAQLAAVAQQQVAQVQKQVQEQQQQMAAASAAARGSTSSDGGGGIGAGLSSHGSGSTSSTSTPPIGAADGGPEGLLHRAKSAPLGPLPPLEDAPNPISTESKFLPMPLLDGSFRAPGSPPPPPPPPPLSVSPFPIRSLSPPPALLSTLSAQSSTPLSSSSSPLVSSSPFTTPQAQARAQPRPRTCNTFPLPIRSTTSGLNQSNTSPSQATSLFSKRSSSSPRAASAVSRRSMPSPLLSQHRANRSQQPIRHRKSSHPHHPSASLASSTRNPFFSPFDGGDTDTAMKLDTYQPASSHGAFGGSSSGGTTPVHSGRSAQGGGTSGRRGSIPLLPSESLSLASSHHNTNLFHSPPPRHQYRSSPSSRNGSPSSAAMEPPSPPHDVSKHGSFSLGGTSSNGRGASLPQSPPNSRQQAQNRAQPLLSMSLSQSSSPVHTPGPPQGRHRSSKSFSSSQQALSASSFLSSDANDAMALSTATSVAGGSSQQHSSTGGARAGRRGSMTVFPTYMQHPSQQQQQQQHQQQYRHHRLGSSPPAPLLNAEACGFLRDDNDMEDIHMEGDETENESGTIVKNEASPDQRMGGMSPSSSPPPIVNGQVQVSEAPRASFAMKVEPGAVEPSMSPGAPPPPPPAGTANVEPGAVEPSMSPGAPPPPPPVGVGIGAIGAARPPRSYSDSFSASSTQPQLPMPLPASSFSLRRSVSFPRLDEEDPFGLAGTQGTSGGESTSGHSGYSGANGGGTHFGASSSGFGAASSQDNPMNLGNSSLAGDLFYTGQSNGSNMLFSGGVGASGGSGMLNPSAHTATSAAAHFGATPAAGAAAPSLTPLDMHTGAGTLFSAAAGSSFSFASNGGGANSAS